MNPPHAPSNLSAAEKDALISTLLERVEQLVAENAALRARLDRPAKTPSNSSKPPSSGLKANATPGGRRKGKAHAGAHRPLHPSPTSKREVLASHCQHCRADVSAVAQAPIHAYDRIEIPEIRPDITRVVLHGGVCPCCTKGFKAMAPAGLELGSPFGPNLRALVLYLRFTQAISFERLARLMSDLLGLEISEGSLVNMLDDSRPAFARQAEAIRQRLLDGTALQSDETSVRVGKQTWWTWVFHHEDSARFVIAPSRGKKVVETFLGDYRPAFWVSDRLAAQMGWAASEHQVCLAHLLRDAQYARDAGDTVLASDLQRLLRRACAIGRRRDHLADGTLRTYAARLEARLDALIRRNPTVPQGQKLLRIVKKHRQNLFVFVTNRAIPPTNNAAEQALRPCVIFRKVTNCFRAEWAAHLYADIRSVIETARRRAIGALDAIRITLRSDPLTAPI